MSNAADIYRLFDGLDDKQAKELAAKMIQYGRDTLKEKLMQNMYGQDDEIELLKTEAANIRAQRAQAEANAVLRVDEDGFSLPSDEADALENESIEAAKASVAKKRSGAIKANLEAEYRGKIAEIVSLVEPHRRKEYIRAIQETYRAQGLNVDSINLATENTMRGRADAYIPQSVPGDTALDLATEALAHHDKILGDKKQGELMTGYLSELAELKFKSTDQKRRESQEIRQRYIRKGLKGV